MSQLGFGVLLNALAGGNSGGAIVSAAIGKNIAKVELVSGPSLDQLRFEMADGTEFVIQDSGQSCCESRYMRTDDDLAYYVGSTLLGVELRNGGTTEGEYGDANEIQFLYVRTSRGVFTLASHNDHNGYYGGFSIEAVEVA